MPDSFLSTEVFFVLFNIATSVFVCLFVCLRFVVMWIIFKVCIEFVTTLLVLCFGFLTVGRVGSELPSQGLNLHPLPWKVKS